VGVAAALGAPGAGALVLDSGDGRGNTSPLPGLTGWRNVGRRLGGPSIVYLGDRWVLTADHVGAGIVVIDGERYNAIASTLQRLRNDDGSQADLLLYRIDGDPGLPALDLARRAPRPGEEVVLVGTGASRGVSLTVRSPRYGLLDGWSWQGADRAKRWGTNVVAGPPRAVPGSGATTWSIPTLFERIDDPNGTTHEAAAAEGDSGGALFAYADPMDPDRGYVLAGVLFSVSSLPEQPRGTSLYGGATYAADVSYYREQVLTTTRASCPEPARREAGRRERRGIRAVCDPADDTVEHLRVAPDRGAGRALLGGLAAVLAWRLLALWRARHSGVT
jgi:hypothetical protein